jgi:rod shape-determining protein MreD
MARRSSWPFGVVLVLLTGIHFYLRPRWYAGRGTPDFLLVGLLIYAFRRPPGQAALAGLVVGLVADTLSPARFGAGMLAHTVVAYATSVGRAVFFADNLLVNAGLFFAGTWFRNLILMLAAGGLSFGALLAGVTLWSTLQAATTALAGTLVVLAIRHRVDVRLET